LYFVVIATLMLLLPVTSTAIEYGLGRDASFLALVGKWFTFWSVGVRLVVAGSRQIIHPRYTAQSILGLEGDDVLLVVRELGFANVAIGTIGVCSLVLPSWVPAGALAGGIFYALAGANHAMQARRNAKQNTAMVSDAFVAAILIVYGVARVIR
jgi:hypothetical protein